MRVRGINTSAVISPGDRDVLDLMSVSGGDIVLSADLDLDDNSTLNDTAGGGLSAAQTAAVDALARVSVTDFTTWPAGWMPMGPPDSSVLGRFGASDPCISVDSTNLLIKCAHQNTYHVHNYMAGNGICKHVNLAEDWTATIKVSSASENFDALPSNTYVTFRLAVILGGGDTAGASFGPCAWFNNRAAATGWVVIKEHKIPGSTAMVYGGGTPYAIIQSAQTDPPDFWLRLEWNQQGFKSSFSLNGSAYTELTVDEYTDPLDATGRTLPRPGLLSSKLVIMAGQENTESTAADAATFVVEEIVFS